MVHHIVLWSLLPELTEAEKQEAAALIKEKLEAVKEKVPGVIDLQVKNLALSSSNRDLALLSTFESVESLNGYQNHPEHLRAAAYVRSHTCERACFDYED